MPVLFSWYSIALKARLDNMKTVAAQISITTVLLSLAVLPAVCFAANSSQILYKCMDESGVMLYTNQKTKDKKCTAISVPVPPPPSNKIASNGVATPQSGMQGMQSQPAPTGGTKTPTPADFPRVSGNEQKGRDGDRRAILDRELATEQANLEKAKIPTAAVTASPEARKTWQDSIALHERNIEALNKEIARLR